MIYRRLVGLAAVVGWLAAGAGNLAVAATNAAPDFQEVYDLLRAHVPGITEDRLKQAAVDGLVAEFPGQVSLLAPGTTAPTNPPTVVAARFDQTVLYLRPSAITATLGPRLQTARQALTTTNPMAGTVLDLRFAGGEAYDAVKTLAAGLEPSPKPLVVLVNSATAGAAELLAAELHEAGALLLGNPTAGRALAMENFPLSNGMELHLATQTMTWHGAAWRALQPDIMVAATLAEERAWLENPLTTEPTGEAVTNRLGPLLDHTSEADLVREKRKDGDGEDSPATPARHDSPQPVWRDQTLARAVDLVKGLAVVRGNRP